MEKTGSSAIQSFMNYNRSVLFDKHGILYPNLKNQQYERGQYHNHEALISKKDGIGDPLALLFRILEYAENRNKRCVVISSESCHNRGFQTLIRNVRAKAEDIAVICYVRRQDCVIESYWKQWFVKDPNFRWISDFVNMIFTEPTNGIEPKIYTATRNGMNYTDSLERWESIVGRDNMIVRAYERQQIVQGDVITDFLNVLDVPQNKDFSEPPDANLNKNIGFSREVLSLIGMCKDLFEGIHDHRVFDWMSVSLGDSHKKKPFDSYSLLSPKEQLRIISRFEENNIWIAKRYLGRADGRLFYDSVPDPEEPWTPYKLSWESAISIMSHLLFYQYQEISRLQSRINNLEDSVAGIIAKKNEFEIRTIKHSGLFDAEYYSKMYPEVIQAGFDPVEHYVRFGWKERRNPSPDFDTDEYLRSNPDVLQAMINPLLHYVVLQSKRAAIGASGGITTGFRVLRENLGKLWSKLIAHV